MTMTRRLALLIAAILLPALLGSLWLHTLAARDALVLEQESRNQDAATALALALSQQAGDAAAMETVAAAQFDLGHYRELILRSPQGQVLFQRQQAGRQPDVPDWFVGAWPIAAPSGRAAVSAGWRELGVLEVTSHSGWVHAALWTAASRTAGFLSVLALLAVVVTAWLLRGWQRPLRATVAQARSIEQGRFELAREPSQPELKELTRSMNAMVKRLKEVFGAQADQVALLQRQAQTDAVTGLLQRRHFVSRIADRLADPVAPGSALLLVRVLRLDAVNERLGFEATDRLLAASAEVLLTYADRVPGAAAGRLNGGDFGLWLPAAGVAEETAHALAQALSASPLARAGSARYAVGGVDGLRGQGSGAALAAADAALAEAEVADAPVVEQAERRALDGSGARAWRSQIASALEQGRTRLAEFPVVDAQGRLIHMECPLRVQFGGTGNGMGGGTGNESGGSGDEEAAYRPARDWLALAQRSRLMPRVDLAALDLALAAIAADGVPRGVHVSQASLAEPGFVDIVAQRLGQAPEAARSLSIEWVESTQPADTAVLRAAALSWRALGVKLGVEHAGASPQALTQWHATRIDYVKVDARHLQGVATDESVRGYAASLVALVHGLGLLALAEGIVDADDLATLWVLGFDGATGQAVGLASNEPG
jgi:EAL domain-containing protein (putative c-di-GMP-specific phosphodiesterase class I)/GGDEF domain-containing protein